MKLRLKPGPGARRFVKSRAQLRRELAQRDEQLADKDALIRMLRRDVGYTGGINEWLTSELTVARARLANATPANVPAPMDRRTPSGDVATETDILALQAAQDADEPVARPYAPAWQVKPLQLMVVGRRTGSHDPTAVPAPAATRLLPAVGERTGETALPAEVGA